MIQDKAEKKHRFEIRFLLVLALFPVIVVIVQLYYTYQNVYNTYHVESTITSTLDEQHWEAIEGIIGETEKRARLQAENIKNNIKHDLLIVYRGNMEQLNADLESHDMNLPCYKIFKTNIEGMFMNVDSYDNRAYVADKDGILTDRSMIKDVAKPDRLWKTEIETNVDPIVASKAVDMILLKDKHIIYWITEGSSKWESRTDSEDAQLTLDSIKKDMDQNGINALKSYDILVPAYISNDTTVLSTPEMIIHGVPETNKKLIIIQSFNLYDALMAHSDDLSQMKSTSDLVKNTMKETIYREIVTLILVIILTLISFGATVYGAVLLIKRSVKDGNEIGSP